MPTTKANQKRRIQNFSIETDFTERQVLNIVENNMDLRDSIVLHSRTKALVYDTTKDIKIVKLESPNLFIDEPLNLRGTYIEVPDAQFELILKEKLLIIGNTEYSDAKTETYKKDKDALKLDITDADALFINNRLNNIKDLRYLDLRKHVYDIDRTTIMHSKPVVDNLKAKLKKIIKDEDLTPELTVVTIGENPASKVYVRNKERMAKEIGIRFKNKRFDEFVETETVVYYLKQLDNPVIVQLPIPQHLGLDQKRILDAIKPEYDVDGFKNEYSLDKSKPVPCTPKGIKTLLDYYDVPIGGANVVIIGRSHIVGQPMAKMLLDADATVTICHSHTKNLSSILSKADIIVSAIGVPNFIKADDFKSLDRRPFIIDVGMNRDIKNKLCGDIDYQSVMRTKAARGITPVPGGVGPLTVITLMEQTVEVYRHSKNNY